MDGYEKDGYEMDGYEKDCYEKNSYERDGYAGGHDSTPLVWLAVPVLLLAEISHETRVKTNGS